jgi:hypothetical protein
MSGVPSARTVCLRLCLRWLSGLVLLAAASAVAWALVVYLNVPWGASYVLAAAVGWTLSRLAHANTAGIVLWCLAGCHGRARAFVARTLGLGIAVQFAARRDGMRSASVAAGLRFDSDEHSIGHTSREHPRRARSTSNHAEKLSPMS